MYFKNIHFPLLGRFSRQNVATCLVDLFHFIESYWRRAYKFFPISQPVSNKKLNKEIFKEITICRIWDSNPLPPSDASTGEFYINILTVDRRLPGAMNSNIAAKMFSKSNSSKSTFNGARKCFCMQKSPKIKNLVRMSL